MTSAAIIKDWTELLANPAVEPRVQLALRAIYIANALALGNTDLVPGRINALVDGIAQQPEEFKVGWPFKGTRHFVGHNEVLTPYRAWLMPFFDAIEGPNRHAILSVLQEVRSSPLIVVKQ